SHHHLAHFRSAFGTSRGTPLQTSRHQASRSQRVKIGAILFCGAVALGCAEVFAQSPTPASASSPTELVMLGTGNPAANPERSGPSVAIVVNDTPYLVDCGPGVVRRASAAHQKGVAGLAVQKLKTLFVTHLHSDHTLGYADVIFSPWVLGRKEALEAYGPSGLKAMTDHLLAAY